MENDILDSIMFPNKNERIELLREFEVFNFLKVIKLDFLSKYKGEVPVEFLFIDTVITWVNEFNYAIDITNIPLFQFVQMYLLKCKESESVQQNTHEFLFNYYSELTTYEAT